VENKSKIINRCSLFDIHYDNFDLRTRNNYIRHSIGLYMYFTRPPWIIRKLFPELIWTIPNDENRVFLTFDDGPDPEATPWVLDLLGKHDAKATFFCLGRNVEKYPELFQRIQDEGHAVGNHTYSHLDGWRTRNRDYFADIEQADKLIGSNLFRPPYGRITPSQIRVLKTKYKIVMWDVLSGDFDLKITTEKCIKRTEKYTKSGSILVFHENRTQKDFLEYLLSKISEKFQMELLVHLLTI